jgi:5-methylcytosine-specific restriction endonuclease McrA
MLTLLKVQTDESVRLEFTLSKEQFAKLQQAQDLLSHALPNQDIASFLEYVADKIIKQKTLIKPKTTATMAVKSGSLSVTTKKALLAQQPCCQFKNPDTGKTCTSTRFLQIDHLIPRWAGGSDDISNLQVLCAQHNNLKYRKEAGIKLSS